MIGRAGIYASVPLELLFDARLTYEQFRVLVALMTFCPGGKTTSWASREKIAQRARMSVHRVSENTRSLVRLGWLTKDGNGGRGCSAHYSIQIPETVTQSVTVFSSSGAAKREVKTVTDWGTKTVTERGTKTVTDWVTPIEEKKEETKEETRGARALARGAPDPAKKVGAEDREGWSGAGAGCALAAAPSAEGGTPSLRVTEGWANDYSPLQARCAEGGTPTLRAAAPASATPAPQTPPAMPLNAPVRGERGAGATHVAARAENAPEAHLEAFRTKPEGETPTLRAAPEGGAPSLRAPAARRTPAEQRAALAAALAADAAKRHPLCPPEVEAEVFDDFVALRKARKAPVSATLIRTARAEADKAGVSLNDFFAQWVLRGSTAMKGEWLIADRQQAERGKTFRELDEERERRAWEQLCGSSSSSAGADSAAEKKVVDIDAYLQQRRKEAAEIRKEEAERHKQQVQARKDRERELMRRSYLARRGY